MSRHTDVMKFQPYNIAVGPGRRKSILAGKNLVSPRKQRSSVNCILVNGAGVTEGMSEG